jgi:transposase
MFDVMKRHEVQVMRKAGHSQVEVSKFSGVSERVVRRIEREAEVTETIEKKASVEAQGIGRPSKVEGLRGIVSEILSKEPDLMSLEVLRRARLAGYGGGKSAMYELIAGLRPPKAEYTMRFEGLPGEFSQHDFGQVDVRFMNGATKRIHFFASRLKYSRWSEVSVVPNQQVEPLVRSLTDHFAAWGGMPLLAVFDRPKTVALEWGRDGKVTDWNPTFAYVALELGLGVELCWPHQPRQKGSDENLVGWVKGSFFKQRRFVDEEDLRSQLAEWRTDVNTKRPSRATGVPPGERMPAERERLRPIKVRPEDLALRVPVQVSPTATVVHDTNLYSMPPESAGFPGTLFLYRDRMRIVAGKYEATHPRLAGKGAKSTLPEHRAARLAAVAGQRGKQYLMREHVLEVGGSALEYLTEITHRRPRAWKAEIERLHEMLQTHGREAMAWAFERAVAEETFGAEYVARQLRAAPKCSPRHPNQEHGALPL